MFKSYLKTAYRNLLRRKGYSLLNVVGLTLGMACCLLIAQYAAFEYSFDRFNENADHVYRVTQTVSRNGGDPERVALTGYGLAPSTDESVPEVARYARVHPNYGDAVVSYAAQGRTTARTFKEDRVFYADPAFLEMFTYPVIAGSPEGQLAEPGTLALSESMARKYFGDENPIGKVLDVTGWVRGPHRVTGVFRDVPANSHLQFDFLLPMQGLLQTEQYTNPESAWGWNNFMTYVELTPGAATAATEQKLWDVVMKFQREQYEAQKAEVTMQLQPLREVHLTPDIMAGAVPSGNYKTVYFFLLIGLITLVIALVNYVNLATARAMDRAREVGVRKAAGANRPQLMGQFLLESGLMNLTALALGVGLALALGPVVNRLADVRLTGALWMDARFWGALLGILCVGALLSGLYPAFVLSSVKPVTALKGRRGALPSRFALRQVLVVVQFAASIVLLVGTIIVYAQLGYMRKMSLGLNLDRVLVVESPRVWAEGADRRASLTTFKNELHKVPGVREVTLSNTVPGQGFNWYSRMRKATADPSAAQDARSTAIDHHFAEVYDLELVAGRYFTEASVSDTAGGVRRVVLNETAVRVAGFESNAEAVDERIWMGGGEFVVIGVLKDFHWSSAHQPAEAVMFQYSPAGGNISLKLETAELQRTLETVRKSYETLYPGNPFEYYFVDEAFDAQYRTDERFATLFGIFAGLAILIACLGLFGLAAFAAEQRTKEIGVRKVLGASVPGIVALLSKDFLKLVAVAFLIAAPVAHYFMSRWLEKFAYRIEPGIGVLLFAGAVAMLVALATVSYQAVRAAVADPVKSLRYE